VNTRTTRPTRPSLLSSGGGVSARSLGRRVAFRADAQLVTLAWVPFAVRLSRLGISLPIGDPRRWDANRKALAEDPPLEEGGRRVQ